MKALFKSITFCLNLFLWYTLAPQFSFANDYRSEDSYRNHLTEINSEWHNYGNLIPNGDVSFQSDEDRIQLHLYLVVDFLSQNTPQNLSKLQKDNRKNLINALKEYAENKVFPTNKYHLIRTPYFVDENNVHCAVGYLMAYSGHADLVARVRNEHNYDYIKDIRTDGVTVWAFNQGFLVDELKWIQPNYGPSETLIPISNGTNGPVTTVYKDNYNGVVLFAGDFDSVNLMPCLNIGVYENNLLSCLGNGLNGTIKQILSGQNEITVFGEFEYNGEIFPIAQFVGGSWNYLSIPTRQNATSAAGFIGGSQYKIEIAISHPSIPNKQEIWYLSNTDVWEKKAMVTGVILDIEASGLGRIYAGNFDTTYRYDSFGIVDSTINTNNVIIKENYSNVWFSIGSEISDTVKAVYYIGNAIYFAGSCSNSSSQNDVFLTRLLNNDMQPLLIRSNFSSLSNVSINSLAFDYGTSHLIFGGDFEFNSGMIYGNNLGRYNMIYNGYAPMAFLDAPVNSVIFSNNEIYIGGDFTTNLGTQSLNHLAKVASTSEINSLETKDIITVSPNPFLGELTIDGASLESKFVLLNANGQILRSGDFENNKVSNLEELPKGFYILKVISMNQETIHRLVK